MIMTTSFIGQQIDMRIHDIVYRVSQQHIDIVKPMVHNAFQQARELETKRANSGDNSFTYAVQGNQGQTDYQSHLIVATTGPSQV